MPKILCIVALCGAGLTACGGGVPDEALAQDHQGLACESYTFACPPNTVCAHFTDMPEEGLCKPPCVNGACSGSQICCPNPYGPRYCSAWCL